MPYVPDPSDATQPTDDKPAGSAAEEFRKLKDAFIALSQSLPINAGAGRAVDNIVALRLLDSNVSTRAFTYGYNKPGDRGHGQYWVDPLDTTSADDGGSIIVGADGARWKLLISGEINLLQFGADPTGVLYCDAAISAAISFAATFSASGIIKIPLGKYRCAAAILHKKGVILEGENLPAYHYYSLTTLPEMSVLIFENNTDGIYYNAAFQRTGVRNLALLAEQHTASTKVGLKLSRGSVAITNSSAFEGVANQVDNVLCIGWKLGTLISGALSFFQSLGKFVFHNCETGMDVECKAVHNTVFEHVYINCNETDTWPHVNRTGVKHRSGGKLIIKDAIIENQANTFEIAPCVYTDYVASARDRQLVVENLYTEAILQSVIKFTAPGHVILDKVRASFGFFNSGCSLIWAAFVSTPTEKSYVSGNDIYFLGNAAANPNPTQANRRFKQIYNGNAITGQMLDINLDSVSIVDNDFESLWNANYPLNRISFAERDDANNAIVLVRNSATPTRALPIYNQGAGHVSLNALQFTNRHGVIFPLNQANRLSQIRPLQPEMLAVSKLNSTGRSNDAVLSIDSELLVDLIDIGQYEIECVLRFYSDNAAVGIKYQLQTTAGITAIDLVQSGQVNGNIYMPAAETAFNVTTFTPITQTAATPDYVKITGVITVNVIGALRLAWAQDVSNANATRLGRGSKLTVRRLD